MKKVILLSVFFVLIINQSYSQNIVINEVMSSNDTTITDSFGDSPDWIELYNTTSSAINLNGYFVSDDSTELAKWKLDTATIQANGFLLIFASDKDTILANSEFHTNFKISSSGETIFFVAPDTSILDFLLIPQLQTDVSYGKQPDGGTVHSFFTTPTPGITNSGNSYSGICADPVFSHTAGFYTDSFYLTLYSPNPGDTVYYTFDGSEPDENSDMFVDSIIIKSREGEPNGISTIRTTIDASGIAGFHYWSLPNQGQFKITSIRAITKQTGYLSSNIITNSYLVDQNIFSRYSTPIFSINTDSLNLFDSLTGIFIPGSNFDPNYPISGHEWETANFAQSGPGWEKPIHIEYFEQNGDLGFSTQAGLKIQGHLTRTMNIKSMRFYLRSEYGMSSINYKLFEDSELENYKRFILRNSGNDCQYIYYRDGFMQSLIKTPHAITQGFKPTTVFINGEYWGMMHLRERFDKYYIEERFNIPNDSLDFLELSSDVIEGDNIDWEQFRDFVGQNDMSDSTNYEYVKTKIDVDNYFDYYSFQFYVNNNDWPQNNVKYFRYKTAYNPNTSNKYKDGRWRYVIYDTDFGFARTGDYNTDIIQSKLSNTGWSAWVIRRMLGDPTDTNTPGNSDFRNGFLIRFADLLNSNFSTSFVKSQIDYFHNWLAPERDEHFSRWHSPSSGMVASQYNKLHTFAELRPEYIRQYTMNWFSSTITGIDTVTLNVSDVLHGEIKINTITVNSDLPGVDSLIYPWTGIYFGGVPITITAIPKSGYVFDSWSDGDTSTVRVIDFIADTSFTANFIVDPGYIAPTIYSNVFINEILASNSEGLADNYGETDDWIEIYNASNDTVQLGGLYISDDELNPTKWMIPSTQPDSTKILPGEFIVLWADEDTTQGVLHLDFKLSSGGENVFLYNTDLSILDSVSFGTQYSDVSYGRFVDGSSDWYFMENNTPGFANDTAGIPPLIIPEIYINEFLTDNNTGLLDDFQEYEDWIEFYNPGQNPVDLGGLYISDDSAIPLFYMIPDNSPSETTIPAGGFLTFWADKDLSQGVKHLDIKLSSGGEHLSLAMLDGTNTIILDSLTFGQQYADTSYGRFPDGSSNWEYFSNTTPTAPNMSDTMPAVQYSNLYINELLAVNNSDTFDNAGEYEDWIEIYNANPFPINLSGLYLTDNSGNLAKWQVPASSNTETTVPAFGFLCFWADDDSVQGIKHTNFKLSGSGEFAAIVQIIDSDTIIIDSLSFGAMSPDISFGRFPDGSGSFYNFEYTTFEASNDTTAPVPPTPIYDLYINEFLASNTSDTVDNAGEFEDWIEIYNGSAQAINLGGLYFTDDFTNPFMHQISSLFPDSTKIEAGEFLIFFADNDINQGIRHLALKLSTAGERIALVQNIGGQAHFIDSLSFGQQTEDISYGRYPDGSNNWITMGTTTPEYANSNFSPNPPDWFLQNATATSHLILVPETGSFTINGEQIEYGDYLGVFFDSLGTLACAGMIMWEEETNSLTVWGEDDGDDGFAEGEEFIWKIWDASENIEYRANANYEPTSIIFTNSGLFATGGISGLLSLEVFSDQIIPLPVGWSMISTYIDPVEDNMDSIFNEVSANTIIVKNNAGLIYWPYFSINTIINHVVGEGYQVKMLYTDTLKVTGLSVVPEENPIALSVGWNTVGYLRHTSEAIATIMFDLDVNIIVVKNGAGQVYWPYFSIDNIGNMNPGEGYKMKMFSADTLLYPPNTSTSVLTKNSITNGNSFLLNTGENMTVCIPFSAWKDNISATECSIIALSESGKLVGHSVFNKENIALTIWGNDPYSELTDGLAENENFHLYLNSGSKLTKLNIEFWTEGSELYSKDKISVVGSIEKATKLSDMLISFNPNPANNEIIATVESLTNTKAEVLIYSSNGKIISKEEHVISNGTNTIKINSVDFPTGVYFINFISGENSMLNQIVIEH